MPRWPVRTTEERFWENVDKNGRQSGRNKQRARTARKRGET